MKRAVSYLAIFCFVISAQAQDEKQVYIKGNIASFPLLIMNFGKEKEINKRLTYQTDFFLSPWKSVYGRHARVLMGTIEGRYYFDESFKNFYVGANVGASVFDITKWNYFYSGNYQKGFNYFFGGVVGYQFNWEDRWNIDIFVGGGNQQAQYKQFMKGENGKEIRLDNAKGWNRSGEWIPYRGGIMLSYKLK